MWSALSQGMISLAVSIITLFPQSPFQPLIASLRDSALIDILGYVNWLLPLSTFARIFVAWLAGIATYMVYQIILRWTKVIE